METLSSEHHRSEVCLCSPVDVQKSVTVRVGTVQDFATGDDRAGLKAPQSSEALPWLPYRHRQKDIK